MSSSRRFGASGLYLARLLGEAGKAGRLLVGLVAGRGRGHPSGDESGRLRNAF